MNSPYKGKFRVSQEFKGNKHDGLDLVGIDSKQIFSTVNGIVERAGWENPKNKKEGFGLYVRILDTKTEDRYYFGHLSKIYVKVGQSISKGDLIGKEGNTGYSFGSHCHYCIRGYASKNYIRNINDYSGIPNKIGKYENKTVLYYPEYNGDSVSIVNALKSLNIDSSFKNRKKIAKANGIILYVGTAKQNTKLLNLLKKGKLKKL